jgi:hypothetical protein
MNRDDKTTNAASTVRHTSIASSQGPQQSIGASSYSCDRLTRQLRGLEKEMFDMSEHGDENTLKGLALAETIVRTKAELEEENKAIRDEEAGTDGKESNDSWDDRYPPQ